MVYNLVKIDISSPTFSFNGAARIPGRIGKSQEAEWSAYKGNVPDTWDLRLHSKVEHDEENGVLTITFMNDDVTLEKYSLLDFYISQKIIKNKVTLFANINNLFNEEYVELYGFSTKGRNVNIGFNLSF